MIIFKQITYRNFLSVGDYDMTIDLNGPKSTLVVGQNGSGKSTLLCAISFALFGKPYRNISKPQLVNAVNGKNCKVTIDFSIGKTDYRIIRGIKPNIFEIYQNGKLINQESHTNDYQKVLEMNILKFSQKSFNQIAILGSANFVPFMQLPTGIRREVVEDLLDITIFSKMNILLKTDSAKLRDLLVSVEHDLKLVEERIRLTSIHLEKLQQLQRESSDKIDREIEELDTRRSEYKAELKELRAQISELSKVSDTKNTKIKKQISTYETLKIQLGEKYKTLKRELDFYEKNQNCPTCHQVIPQTLKSSKTEECKSKGTEILEALKLIQDSLADADSEMKRSLEQLADVQRLRDKEQSTEIHIESLSTQIEKLKNRKVETSDHNAEQKELGKLWKNQSEIEHRRAELIEQRSYNEVLSELLKDTGIKTKITQQYIPVINKLVNKYLQILDFFVLFNLDDNFSETIKSRHRDEFSYASFSEGEKQRIDLSLLFTWRQIAKMKNSMCTNLLIFDEVVDSSLDGEGIDNFLKIIDGMGDQTNIFVISHKTDSFEGKFAQKLEFTKVNNFTRLK